MRLSELHTGEKATIIKVAGHGSFRKRIMEMGFITGQQVEALLNAPLQDPVKYRVMGYEVSLRQSEAALVEVDPEAADGTPLGRLGDTGGMPTCAEFPIAAASPAEGTGQRSASPRKSINVALVGNPNCGKTSLFNFASGAHERVGNYSGVTVDAKEGHAEFGGYRLNLVDLPGTYSLAAYSPEELYVRRQIIDHTPDVIVNVIDTSNLERNLYLTTQIIDMHMRMVVALNMFDETERRGDIIDTDKLSLLFGVPMIPTVFTTGKGVDDLFQAIVTTYEGTEDADPHYRHIHINHGHELERGISLIQEHLKPDPDLRRRYSTRYLAIKLLEGDGETEKLLSQMPDCQEIFDHRDEAARRVREETGIDSSTAIMDAKYGFIHGALAEAGYKTGSWEDTYHATHLLDRILTNRWFGFPLFLAMLVLLFWTTFSLGQYPMEWLETAVEWLGSILGPALPDGPVRDMVVDGIIGGVGSVVVFLPQILILYFFLSFMEDCGYMARAAFIMDRLMHGMGLHGKSFIPLIMGFGCNVPAMLATRTIESRRSRLVTMLILPLMSCEARIPIYIMLIGAFFAPQWQAWIMMSVYLWGIVLAIVLSKLFCRFLVRGEDTPFVMELPPYRFPTWRALARHTWEKGKQYLRKMGGIILVASIVVWALGYFPHDGSLDPQRQQEQSYIGRIGKAIEPIFRVQGFSWKLDVGIVAGVGAKEIVASTLGVLYADDHFSDDSLPAEGTTEQSTTLRSMMEQEGITPATAYCYLLFVLIYFPCIATISAVKGETGRWRWAIFAAGYTTILAYIVSAVVAWGLNAA